MATGRGHVASGTAESSGRAAEFMHSSATEFGSAAPSVGAASATSGEWAGVRRERHGAIVIDRSRNSAKRLGRVLSSAGYSVKIFEDEPASVIWSAICSDPEAHSWLIVGELFAAGSLCSILQRLEARRHCRGVLYYGGKDAASSEEPDIATLCEQQGLLAILGMRGTATRDLETELWGIASYLRGQPLLPLQAYLLWGAASHSAAINNVGGRDAAEERIIKLCSEQLSTGSRVTSGIAEVVHELLTNAMYAAPIDRQGRALYAHDRTAEIQLASEDRVNFRYGTDGLRLAVETVDRFGRLRRADLIRSLRRAASGQVNRAAGGAGIGLSMVYRTVSALQIDVEPGSRTRITAVFDLEPARVADGGRASRSLIFPDLTMASGRRDT